MTYQPTHIGKATTAIAAVLAFASAPSFAQETGAAPEPTVEESPAAIETAPPPAPEPKVETTASAAKPAKASAPVARPTARRASAAAPAAAPVASADTIPVETAAPAPLPAGPAPAAVAEPAAPPATEPAPASVMSGALIADIIADDRLPYAGAAALGLLALGGAGLVSRRRKRRREDEAFEARQQILDRSEAEAEQPLELGPADEVRAEPAFGRAGEPIHDPTPAKNAPPTNPPAGFDVSRFGPHVQAAYGGPTADNPSVSLEYRLRRAAVMDREERKMPAQAPSATQAPANIPARGNWESRTDADFLFRRARQSAEREVERQ